MSTRATILRNIKNSWGGYSLSIHRLQPYLDDKEIVMASVRVRPLDYKYASLRLKHDKDVAITVARNTNKKSDVQNIYLNHFPLNFKNDIEIVKTILAGNSAMYKLIPDELKNNKLIAIQAITKDGNLYADMPLIFRMDKNIFMSALITCNIEQIFTYIPGEIKSDPVIGEKIIYKAPKLIKKMPALYLKNNKLVKFATSNKVDDIVGYLTDEQKNDKDLMVHIIKHITNKARLATTYAILSPTLKHDDDIVNIAIKIDGSYIKYGSDMIKNTPICIVKAIKTCPSAITYGSDKIQNDYNLISYLLLININVYEFISDEFKNDLELALIMCRTRASLLKHASERIKNNKCLVRLAVENDPTSFEHASVELKSNKQYITRLTMLELNIKIMKYISGELLNDEEFMLEKIKYSSEIMTHMPMKFRNDVDFALKILKLYPDKYEHFSHEVKNKTKFILNVYKNTCDSEKIKFLKSIKSHVPAQHICVKYLTETNKIQSVDSKILMNEFS